MKISLTHSSLMSVILSSIILLFLFVSQLFLEVLNKNLQNQYYTLKHQINQKPINPHIIVVELDDDTFKTIGSFPLKREVYAQALKNLSFYNPAVIAFDILFLDSSDQASDTKLEAAFQTYPHVVLGASVNPVEKTFYAPIFTTPKFGFLSPNIFPGNNTVYSFSPIFEDANGKKYEHFSLAILRSFYQSFYQKNLHQEIGIFTPTHYNLTPDTLYPLSQKNTHEILIDFRKPENFQNLSFSDLLDLTKLQERAKKIDFRDSIILIGPAAEGLKDEFFTPLGNQYGVYIHANILNTLLSKNYILYFDRFQEWILIFCIVILSVWINLSYHGKKLLFGNAAIILIFWGSIPLAILFGTNLILNYPVQIIFSLLLSIMSANAVKYLIEDANKRKLNKALSEYVGTNIAQEILFEEGKVNLDGEERNLLYFFSDIEGFTSLSEKLSPHELVIFLREYLTLMTSCIMESGGYVDKFEGDAIMAFWGAFSPLESVSYISLCESALAQQKALIGLNLTWKEKFGHELSVRMGLHGGDAIVGNIGALGKKMDFTALGDNVNLASRLEGVNKFYGTYICASEAIYLSTREVYFYRFLDEIQVVGKEESVKIYELLGKREEISPELQEKVKRFTGARDLYAQKKFQQATAIFQELQAAGDIPSQTYITRCENFLTNPPEADWNGIWIMVEK